MIWSILSSLATIVSTVAIVVSALYIRAELKGVEKDRYLAVTSALFEVFQSREFMEDQLAILHKLEETTWKDFVAAHRADPVESAFHRVGSFYDRVGTLVRLGLVNEKEVLSTLAGYAIAVWKKIGPLVLEARGIENSMLFDDFERLLPGCYECYVPSLDPGKSVTPFTLQQRVDRITARELKQRMDGGERIAILDVRQPEHFASDNRTIPGSVHIPPDDLEQRYAEVPASGMVVAFCT